MKTTKLLVLLLATASLAACNTDEEKEPKEVALNFQAVVGNKLFECGQTYMLGNPAAEYQPLEASMYVYDIALRNKKGEWKELSFDGVENAKGFVDANKKIALIDFAKGREKGSPDTENLCEGTPETNTVVKGKVPDGAYDAVRFKVGVPYVSNHLDYKDEEAPLNIKAMFWSWLGGYKFMRFDGKTPHVQTYQFHLGATDCTGPSSVKKPTNCLSELNNRVIVELTGYNENSKITFDYKKFFSSSDLSREDSGGAKGCMSGETDPECAPLFEQLGLGLGTESSSIQQVFSLK